MTESAIRMEPGIVPLIPPPKVPRGFILINLSGWDQDKLRSLAQENGVELRSVLRWAITQTRTLLDEKIQVAKLAGISARDCSASSAGTSGTEQASAGLWVKEPAASAAGFCWPVSVYGNVSNLELNAGTGGAI